MSYLDEQLITAAETGDLPGVQAALAAGANVHARDEHALRWAAQFGHLAVVECLITAGADIHSNDDCALRWAAEMGHLDLVRYLLASGAHLHASEDYALRISAENGHAPLVEFLIAAGANARAEITYALGVASGNGHTTVVRLLRKHGAGIEAMMPMTQYRKEVQVALLAEGDVRGLSVIDLARRGVCPDALCVLLERQSHGALAIMIRATQMMEPLAPEARSALLGSLLANPGEVIAHVGP